MASGSCERFLGFCCIQSAVGDELLVTRRDDERLAMLATAPTRAPSKSTSWRAAALCTGKTELFFEAPGERRTRRERREATARAYCAACPVSEPCREWARANRENGLWGGENDEERAFAGYAPVTIFRRNVAVARRCGLEAAVADDGLVAPDACDADVA